MRRMTFCDWDRRPAVLFGEPGEPRSAVAKLAPVGEWSPIDADDVMRTAPVFPDEAAFRASFRSSFGAFDLPEFPKA